jgi:hypothetical protein
MKYVLLPLLLAFWYTFLAVTALLVFIITFAWGLNWKRACEAAVAVFDMDEGDGMQKLLIGIVAILFYMMVTDIVCRVIRRYSESKQAIHNLEVEHAAPSIPK